jgi:hypothetical protein
MKNLLNQKDVAEMLERIDLLQPGTTGKWGEMNVAQMLAHCNRAMETTMGENIIPRVGFIGRTIGSMMKKGILSEKPFGKNSPTDKTYIFKDDQNFEENKQKIKLVLQKFQSNGPLKVTTHPHPFFGNFTAEEWARFQWKHLDHHLRQFGV